MGIARVQSTTQDAVQNQCYETDRRMGADAMGQSVVDRFDLDFGLQYAKASLYVGQ